MEEKEVSKYFKPIQRFMEANNKSLREFAELVGLSPSALTNIKNGVRKPSRVTIRKIVRKTKGRKAAIKYADMYDAS